MLMPEAALPRNVKPLLTLIDRACARPCPKTGTQPATSCMKVIGRLKTVSGWHIDTTPSGAEGMKVKGSIELFQYWDRLREGRSAPRRTDIEPADIKTLLADTFILELDVRSSAIFRLAGTRLCAAFGRELKGFSFSSLWTSKDERVIARLAHSVLNQKSVVLINAEAVSQSGRILPLEWLLLPLDGGSDNPRALGSSIPLERPFWIGSDSIKEMRITTLRVIDADREPMFLKNRPEIAVPPLDMADMDVAENVGTGTKGRRIRHLLVIDGGKDN